MLDDIIDSRIQSLSVHFFLLFQMLLQFSEMLLIDMFQYDTIDIVLDIRHLVQTIREDLDQFVIGV